VTAAWAAHLPAGIDPDELDLLTAGNLPRAWARHWAIAPGRVAVADDDGWITAGELEDRSRQVAGRFAAAGLVAGDRFLVSASASVPLVVAHVAALRLGLVVVPANTAYREREVAHLVRDATPAAALVDDGERAGWVAAAAEAAGIRHVVVGLDVDLPDGPDPVLDHAGLADPALLAYTSGTTGIPKGAVLSHANLLASAEALALAWRWTPDDRLVLALPLFHLHGLGVGLHGTLGVGASVVLRRSFAVNDVLDRLAAERASLFFGVPTMWSRLAASSRADELAALRLGVSGSAPLPAELHRAIEAASGQRVIERYGMTETVMNVSNPYDGERRPGTVGLPLPGVEVRLDDGTDEILLRGPNVFAGYRGRPDATTEAFTDDGWFRSGDVGKFDPDGYLRIVGRRKELIISGGFNVYPREVEDVLRTHPSVTDAAVIGVAHPDWGEEVVAVIEAVGPIDAAAILAHAGAELAAYKRPKRVVVVDALPRNALGKVVKADLGPVVG
jgi:malonyl-CoA/methylmalonyl-CoA synthetase